MKKQWLWGRIEKGTDRKPQGTARRALKAVLISPYGRGEGRGGGQSYVGGYGEAQVDMKKG